MTCAASLMGLQVVGTHAMMSYTAAKCDCSWFTALLSVPLPVAGAGHLEKHLATLGTAGQHLWCVWLTMLRTTQFL